jgi:hypothetical protein
VEEDAAHALSRPFVGRGGKTEPQGQTGPGQDEGVALPDALPVHRLPALSPPPGSLFPQPREGRGQEGGHLLLDPGGRRLHAVPEHERACEDAEEEHVGPDVVEQEVGLGQGEPLG